MSNAEMQPNATKLPRPALTVLQILPELNGGGVERGTLEIAEALVRACHRSLVVSAGGRMVAELERAGSTHITLPIAKKSPFTFLQAFALRKLLLREHVDVVHIRSRLPGWLAVLALKMLPAAQRPHLVSTVHGLYSVNRYSAVMTRGEVVIAVSETVRRYIAENYPDVPAARVKLIYRGIDPQAFPRDFQPSTEWLDAWRSEYPQLQGKRVLCLPGRITRLKGHDAFIDLIKSLRDRGHDIAGLIVGGEDPRRAQYAQEMRDKVQALGLAEAVIFTGHRRDVREIYTQADLVLSLSSKPESFGRTVLETLALGRPVAGWDHGGVGEILSALFPAGKVPLNDRAQLLARVEALLHTPEPPLANDRFLLANMCAETLAIYRQLSDQY